MPDEQGRVTISTYVPAHQRERWREDAERLGMNQSEFVRTMVQAGRRGFALEVESGDPAEGDLPGFNPRGNDLRTALLELLRNEGPLEWGELVRELTGDLEDEIETVLTELQAENQVQHSGRRGGYALAGDSSGE